MSLAIIDATYRTAEDLADGIGPSRYVWPVGNVPLISHVVGDLACAGVTRARVIARPGAGDELAAALRAGRAGELRVEVVEASPSAPHRQVLEEVETALAAGPVVLAPGDELWPGLVAAMCARLREGDVDLVLGATDAEGRDLPGVRVTGSAIVLGREARLAVAGLLAPDAEQVDLPRALAHGELRLAVCEGRDGWSYAHSTDALLTGNRQVLDRLPDAPLTADLGEGNELRGRISVGEGVRASGCVIHGPVAIADHAILEDSHVGPFTAVGPGTILSGAELDDSIVLRGAEIRHPGHRITASIIGEGARVERTFQLPRGVQMRLGPHSRLSFS